MVEDIIDFRMLFEEDGFSGVTTEIEREIFSDGPDDSFFQGHGQKRQHGVFIRPVALE